MVNTYFSSIFQLDSSGQVEDPQYVRLWKVLMEDVDGGIGKYVLHIYPDLNASRTMPELPYVHFLVASYDGSLPRYFVSWSRLIKLSKGSHRPIN